MLAAREGERQVNADDITWPECKELTAEYIWWPDGTMEMVMSKDDLEKAARRISDGARSRRSGGVRVWEIDEDDLTALRAALPEEEPEPPAVTREEVE